MKKHLPLISALAALALLLAVSLWQVRRATGGHFCYPLDDSFIHLSIAKHLAQNGVWGITAEEYSAASSSPLYTLLLALLIRAGFQGLAMPFWLNVLFAVLLLFTAARFLQQYRLKPWMAACILQAIVWLTPLPVMIFTGMEHLLHTWLVLLFIQLSLRVPEQAGWKPVLWTGITGALTILSRFESLFVLGAVILLLLYYRRFRQSFFICLLALLPAVLAGWLSLRHGGHWLPNSVLLKGSHLGGGWAQLKSALAEIGVYRLMYGNNTLINTFMDKFAPAGASSLSGTALVRLLLLVPVLLLFTQPQDSRDRATQQARQFACIWLAACFLHLALAAVGWLFRYEAYLIATGIFITGVMAGLQYGRLRSFLGRQWLPGKLAALFFVLFATAPLLLRAGSAGATLVRACKNIYDQQFHMAAFLQRYYQHTPIAANDVGAISYYGNNRIVDLWGLGNNQVAASKLRGQYNAQFLYDFARKEGVKIAVIYDDWFPEDLRRRWIPAGTWTISNNVICGSDKVSFYATDSSQAAILRRNLQQFTPSLPADVKVVINN